MRPIDDVHLRNVLRQMSNDLPLRYASEEGIGAVRSKVQARLVRKRRRSWRAIVLTAAAVLVIGPTSVAVASVVAGHDPIWDAFTHAHPKKADVSKQYEEKHVALGTVSLGGGLSASGFVTTSHGPDRCVVVQQLDSHGKGVIVTSCSREPSEMPALVLVNGALIGWVPGAATKTVSVSGDGYEESAQVISQQFILGPPNGVRTGMPLEVIERDGSGHALARRIVRVNDS